MKPVSKEPSISPKIGFFLTLKKTKGIENTIGLSIVKLTYNVCLG